MPWPKPTQLGLVTPSSGEALRACALRVAYSLDEACRWLCVPSTWSILGRATHHLCEIAVEGALDDCSSEEAAKALAQRVWDEEVRAGEEHLLGSAAVLAPAPAVDRWPGYHLSRTRAVRRALQDYRHGGSVSSLAPCLGEAAKWPGAVEPLAVTACREVEVEVWLEDAEHPLAGRLDRLESNDGRLEVYDLKSAFGGHEGLRPSHRRQLLVYSYLVRRARGGWPARAGVRYLDGQEDVVEVVPAEAQTVAFELLSLLQDYNQRVTSSAMRTLANPSDEACQFCDYKCLCEPFFDWLNPAWNGRLQAVLGEVISVATCGQSVRLQLRARSCSFEAESGEVGVRGLPERLRPAEGALVALSGLRHDMRASTLSVCHESRMCVWAESASPKDPAA